jgi:hypothetical protein
VLTSYTITPNHSAQEANLSSAFTKYSKGVA